MLDDKKPNSTAGLINTLSIDGSIDLLILASCISNSKSETALKPRNITVAECCLAKSTSSLSRLFYSW